MNTKKDASVLSLFISKKTKHLISLYSFSGRTLPLAPAFQNSIPEPDHSPFHTAFWPVPLFQKSAGGGLSYKVKKSPLPAIFPPVKEIFHLLSLCLPMQIKAHAANHNSAANDISNSNRQQINSHKTAPVKPCQFFCSQPI